MLPADDPRIGRMCEAFADILSDPQAGEETLLRILAAERLGFSGPRARRFSAALSAAEQALLEMGYLDPSPRDTTTTCEQAAAPALKS